MSDQIFPYAWPDFVKTIIGILSDGALHSTQELRTRVVRAHSIRVEHLRITQADGQNIFVNTVAQVFAGLSSRQAAQRKWTESGDAAYQMTRQGLEVVSRVGREQVTINDF